MLEKSKYDKIPVEYVEHDVLFSFPPKDPFEKLILSMAYIYNDMKDLHLLYADFTKRSSKPNMSVNSYIGEYGGLDNHLKRMIMSGLSECIEFLENNLDDLRDPRFVKLLSRSKKHKKRWKELLEYFDKPTVVNSNFKSLLYQIRSNVSFHYYGSHKVLPKSYQNFFNRTDQMKFNKYAYFSIGTNIEATRFYFADAAAQEYMESMTSQHPDFDASFFELLKEFIDLMLFIVACYISDKELEAKNKD